MAESNSGAQVASAPKGAADATASAAIKAQGNPVFRMMGLPNIKPKLPSRNWMIFLSITGTFAGLVYYDKRETKRIQQHYCDLVSPLAEKTLPTTVLPRKMTVYLQAPPADGLRSAREHFYDYVKPVLVAGAMDWDVVEGRKEGDLRFGAAEKIRQQRRRMGEGEEEETKDKAVREQRERVGTQYEEGVAGDVVIGRHAWKEYIRGVHEGWLGPVVQPVVEEIKEEKTHVDGAPSLGDAAVKAAAEIATPAPTETQDASPAPEEQKSEEPKPEEKPKPKNSKPGPYISTSDYHTAITPSTFPSQLGPAVAIPLPHILGLWNFPIRIWRFLNRRELAEEVSRTTAAAVLASHREWRLQDKDALEREEGEWHKSVKVRKDEQAEGIEVKREERVWLDEVVVDERLSSRMRVFELNDERE